MRWETQMEAVRMTVSTRRIRFDQLWLRLDQPTTTRGTTPGADAPGSVA